MKMVLLCRHWHGVPRDILGELLPPKIMQLVRILAHTRLYWHSIGETPLFDFDEEQTENHCPPAWP